MKKHTFSIKTFGCKVNQYEEQVLRENLNRFGFEQAAKGDPDFFIINSCTVTEEADRKTKRSIRRVKRDFPGTKIIVTGCLAVLDEDVKNLQTLSEIWKIISGNKKYDIPEYLYSYIHGKHPQESAKIEISEFNSHTRAFLKIQDGCNNKCSYCKVNMVRGGIWSRKEDDLVKELCRLLDRGYKEIVLTGICLGAWQGSEGKRLADLFDRFERINGDFRIRLSSIDPLYIDKYFLKKMMDSSKLCRHLHIPLQHGADRILSSMNRNYTAEEYRRITDAIREKMPGIGLSIDVIAGFPGETTEDFDKMLTFLRKIKPSRVHVFKYSERKGTRSSTYENKVSLNEAGRRSEIIRTLGSNFKLDFCKKWIKKKLQMLVERKSSDGYFRGYSGEYVEVRLKNCSNIRSGALIIVDPNAIDESVPCLLVEGHG
ncbi:MAG: tRNA (N(6)-L-threonylcarbamoyladenosine(37)-C(2))-methylthiotransferase MtaB [Candidatus Omnitrophota bacterium]